MGPLIPQEIISEGWNFVVAFVIGIGFGAVLEQAGFTSSRKLAGVFYGYDTVVLKVFFTAAITGMLGLLYFSLFGWIDLNLVYVNPMFIGSAIVGGIIMGIGFITGGFCPGTSACAVANGKIDAIVFFLSMFVGIFIFAEVYPLIKGFYMSGNLGPVKLSEALGISQGVLAIGVIIAAVLMFWVGEWAEKKFPQEEY